MAESAVVVTPDVQNGQDAPTASRVLLDFPPFFERKLASLKDDPLEGHGQYKPMTKEDKEAFVHQLFKSNFAFYDACHAFGRDPLTIKNHLKWDKDFRSVVELASRQLITRLEGTAIGVGLTPQGTTDRWNLLKAHRPDVYGRNDAQINVGVGLNFSLPDNAD